MSSPKPVSDVFGVAPEIRPESYVDRGELDAKLARHLKRQKHIFLRGESKCGKSWLRQHSLPDAIVTRCRHNTTCVDLYTQALSQLDVQLVVDQRSGDRIDGRVEFKAGAAAGFLAKIGLGASIGGEVSNGVTSKPVGRDIHDLAFITQIFRAAERRLVFEDIHYLAASERERFAYDLKAFWDESLFVVAAGVWSDQSMLTTLNSDLSTRVTEIEITWKKEELAQVVDKGGNALNLLFADDLTQRAIEDAYGNVGILQDLMLAVCDHAGIEAALPEPTIIEDLEAVEAAAMFYADQINPVYQRFAERVSGGIRKRESATNIYAHALAAIMEAGDTELIDGVPIDTIYKKSRARQPRIQKPNLHSALMHIGELQVDERGLGLVLAYNETERFVHVIDRQLLVYRKYMTKSWPFEDLIAQQDDDPSRLSET